MKMDRLPEIGERVRYHSVSEFWDRECTGTVRKIYPGFDDEGRPVAFEDDPEAWHAGIEVDAIPSWWPYPGTNRFAPSITDLTPA
jgi:hypothetical protein